MNNPKALKSSHLFFSFDQSPLLTDISFEIEKHQFVAIIGPNGSGKTTLLKLLMGFLKPTQGEVLLFGKSPEKMHKHIGYVPQVSIHDQKFPLSVLDVVLMGALSKLTWYGAYPKNIKEKARAMLDFVGLKDLENRPFGTLSGGQVQKALIARAIMDSPTMLFLDEPTANIDQDTNAVVLNLLVELKKTMTIVMVTHQLQAVVKYLDRILCVQNTLTEFSPDRICEHFTFGLYHPPLLRK